ncbi:2-polyprenyl-3-methyl-6-methoxy-1,4-benzoquinone monooxygenase [Paucibacter sp. AS339]|uniref:2-polyprenyl-3-methyl-6-methoxy-1,4-benzoquinone monooxygenase n=1 Tax=Paucibacter hankyongi TaxID=3133434 RepID=UPI0030A49801
MPAHASLSPLDQLLTSVDHGLRTVFGVPQSARPSPAAQSASPTNLSAEQKQLSAALMRVNHVGEVCAQALYQSQALLTHNPGLREHFKRAAKEEVDHLAWTHRRIEELGGHISHLTPLWYGGAFAIGSLAALAGDQNSLGFVVETERQVEQHLASHLDRLPAADHASRAIITQMKIEEASHAEEALAAGAKLLPAPVKGLMRLSAKLMTHTAHYI